MNTRRKILLSLLTVLCIVWAVVRQSSIAQQSDSPAPSETTPQPTASPLEPTDVRQDPLFNAILEEVRGKRESLIPEESREAIEQLSATSDEVSSAKWRAIELILRAARVLENDDQAGRQTESNQKRKSHQETVKTLRGEAIKLILDF